MTSPHQSSKPLFLLDQQISLLEGTRSSEECRFHVYGGGKFEGNKPEAVVGKWTNQNRDELIASASGKDPAKRVALACDAGLGKTTNMAWVQARIAAERNCRGRQLPFLVRFDNAADLQELEKSFDDPDSLLDWMAREIKRKAGSDVDRNRRALERLRSTGRITLLLDGLDHVVSLRGFSTNLHRLMNSVQWQNCPIWIAGRPYAFKDCWKEVFAPNGPDAPPDWQFLRVEPLAKAEIQFYLSHVTNSDLDWYSEFTPETWSLLAVPRMLALVCVILKRKLEQLQGEPVDPYKVIKELDLRTAADVYYQAYFDTDIDNYNDPDRQGLLAQGLSGRANEIGLGSRKPSQLNMVARVKRTAVLLGAIAFTMFTEGFEDGQTGPNTSGVSQESLLDGVAPRLQQAKQGSVEECERDMDCLRQMNNNTLEYLLFREANQNLWVFHNRTVQAFFAAHWATNYATPDDFEKMQRWIIDHKGERLDGFNEFWTFAAEMPQVDTGRWLDLFEPCYTPPPDPLPSPPISVKDDRRWVEWHRRMLYHSYDRMNERFPAIIDRWRALFLELENGGGTSEQQAVYKEIVKGFQSIPGGYCQYGADPVKGRSGQQRWVDGFRLHQWAVTNRMYELFDPSHGKPRSASGEVHPLSEKPGREGEDYCPVVNVTWYDAWCFAAWCGCRLPTDLEWEHACRAGTDTRYYFADKESDLATMLGIMTTAKGIPIRWVD